MHSLLLILNATRSDSRPGAGIAVVAVPADVARLRGIIVPGFGLEIILVVVLLISLIGN